MKTKKLLMTKLANLVGISDYRMLSFRPFGEKAKEIIKTELNSLDSEGILILDFFSIEMCDVSFVDEAIFEVIEFIRQNKLEKTLIIMDTDEDVFETIRSCQLLKEDKKLKLTGEKFNIPFLFLNKDTVSIIGDIESNLLETFDFVSNNAFTTARDIANNFNISINGSSNRLKKLNDYKLILRTEIVDVSGKYYKYYCPNPFNAL